MVTTVCDLIEKFECALTSALTSARELSAVFDPDGRVTPAVGRSNGSVTTSLHSALTNRFVISETRELWRILT